MSATREAGACPRTVLLVHSSAGRYGADRALALIACGLDRERYRPLVVLPHEGPLADELRAAGVRTFVRELAVLRRQHMTPAGIATLALRARRAARELAAIARDERAVLVHSNSSVLLGTAAAARAAGVPHLQHVREIYDGYPRALWRVQRRRLLRSDLVVCVSAATARQFGAAALEVLHDGLPPAGDAAVERSAARAGLGLREGDHACVVLGRLTEWKGQSVLLRALAEPALTATATVAIIAGDAWPGQEDRAQALRDLATRLGLGERARFVGFREPGELYGAADVVVVPSTRPEPFGLVALEAAAAGCCVVAAAHGGLVEIVRDGETGSLVRPGDPAALAAVLAGLAADPRRRQALGRAAAADVRDRLSAARLLDGVQALYDRLIGGPRHPPAGD